MKISVGVFTYNDEDKIRDNLDSIINQTIRKNFKEILVFSESTDKTNEIIREYEKRYREIRAIISHERKGKVNRINEFLHIAKGEFLIMCSADIVLKENCIEEVIKSLKKPQIGIVGVRVIPRERRGLIGEIWWLEWDLLDKISHEKPKFGELIGFKPVIEKIEEGSVDEEQIHERILSKGYMGIYNPKAIVYNFPPKNLASFISQRRRIFCGHLELKKKKRFSVPTLNSFYVLKILLKNLHRYNIFVVLLTIGLEGIARFLGWLDFITRPSKHYLWKR